MILAWSVSLVLDSPRMGFLSCVALVEEVDLGGLREIFSCLGVGSGLLDI